VGRDGGGLRPVASGVRLLARDWLCAVRDSCGCCGACGVPVIGVVSRAVGPEVCWGRAP
jgi:hypothetical protein